MDVKRFDVTMVRERANGICVLYSDYEALNYRHVRLEDAYVEISAELASFRAELAALEAKYSSTINDCEVLKNRLEDRERDIATWQQNLADRVESFSALEAKYAALKDAARPVVKDWKEERSVAVDINADKEVGYVVATFEQLDALAALVVEEK